MDEHRKFLADHLLSEEQPISYRLLSRKLDVHVNTAKEMLYDFHVYQNEQKANSVHATYLIYGVKTPQKEDAGGDVEMTMSSSLPTPDVEHEEVVPTYTLSLVREEDLAGSLAEHSEVLSIHVYSLAPHPQRDFSLLADLTKQVAEYTVKEQDPVAAAKKYGTISNPHVRRRTRKGPTPVKPGAPTASKAQTAAAKPKAEAPAVKPKVEPKEKESNPGSVASKVKKEGGESSQESTPAPSSKPTPSLKRGASGGIAASFAKAANMPKKPAKKKEEDTAMALSDDGEADEDDIPAPKRKATDDEATRKSRKEREEELRRMMEEDEENESDDEAEEKDDPVDQEMEEAPEPEPEPAPQEKVKDEPAEVISSTEGGRRRGRRKVMQKKRILDDQGYMVTIQEPGWESFSEDEAPPPSKKAAPAPSKEAAAKSKKPAGKAGQGNIMSFFSKK